MTAYPKPTTPQIQLLIRCVSPPQRCASRAGRRLLHCPGGLNTTGPGGARARPRAVAGLNTARQGGVDHSSAAMSRYLRVLLSLYQKCGFSSTSTSPSPPLGPPNHKLEDRVSSRSLSRRQQSASFSSTASSSSSSEEQSTDNTQQTRTTREDLDFSKLSQMILDESPTGTQSIWYVMTAAALLAFHHEPGVGDLWAYISRLMRGGRSTEDEQIAVARRIREACLKASVLVGFPRVCSIPDLHEQCSTISYPHGPLF